MVITLNETVIYWEVQSRRNGLLYLLKELLRHCMENNLEMGARGCNKRCRNLNYKVTAIIKVRNDDGLAILIMMRNAQILYIFGS